MSFMQNLIDTGVMPADSKLKEEEIVKDLETVVKRRAWLTELKQTGRVPKDATRPQEQKELQPGEFILKGVEETRALFPLDKRGLQTLPSPDTWKKKTNDPGYMFDVVWEDGYHNTRPLSDFALTRDHLKAIEISDFEEQTRHIHESILANFATEPIAKVFDIGELIQKKQHDLSDPNIKWLTTKEVFEAIDAAGYRPASLIELLAYAKANWKPLEQSNLLTEKEKEELVDVPSIVAFGSPFTKADDRHTVPCLERGGTWKNLTAYDLLDDWYTEHRFLVIRKPVQ
jgi:hypothetical protein